MPPDADSRRALLERIITAGDRRRRRWLLSSGMALAVSTLSIALLTGGDETQLAVTDDPAVSSTTSSTAEPTPDTSTDTTESPSTSSTTDADPATSTSTSEAPPVCRNSHDPRCGPFYWDYDPATWPNKPVEISVTSSPATVVAGEPVTFSIRFFDPDVAWADNCARASFPGSNPGTDEDMGYSFGDAEYDFGCAMPGCAIEPQRYGPWDPPPPRPSEQRTRTVSRVYPEPGDYTVRVEGRTEWFCTFPGYNSEATITVPVHVVPAPIL